MSKPTIHRAMLLRDEPRLQAILPQGAILCGQEQVDVVLATDYATLESENAKLRAELERRAVDAITMEEVQRAYDYATEHPHKYLRGSTNWCAAVAYSLNQQRVADPSAPKCSTCRDVGVIGHSEICPDCADTWEPAPKADDPVKVQGEDTARLDFMLSRHRSVVVEHLPDGNFSVYVEEGFIGGKIYPSVSYSGRWTSGSPEELGLKRKAIDAAIAAARKEGGKV